MHKADVNLKNPRLAKPLGSGSQPTGVHSTRTEEGQRESIRILGMNIAQTAVQGIGMSTKDPWGPPLSVPQYALAVSLIFTKATNQTIILGTPPKHVLSTSILWSSLAHDKRFEQIPMSEAAPGDIIIEPGWQRGADSYVGIVVDHGRIVSNSSQGVQSNSSLLEIQRHHPEMVAFCYVGFWNYYRSKPLANAGFDPNEPRNPAGQPGGGQWTTGGAGTEPSSEGWFSALTSKLKAFARILQHEQNCSNPAGLGTNGSDPLGDELATQVAQMSPAEREQFIKGYKQGVKEALPLVAPFVPVLSQIQSVATLTDPKASTVDKAVAAIGMIPEAGGVVKDAGAVAKDVVTAEEAAAKAAKAAQILKNAETGAQRAVKTAEELAAENPGEVVQGERTLRDAAGNKVPDPVTGEARRVDHAVIDRDANTAKTYETTGDKVDKRLQQKKEERIRDAGGTFIRDKETGKLIPVENVSEIRRQK